MRITEAAEAGTRRQLLVALRIRLAAAMDYAKGRDLVALSRQLEAIGKEIVEIDAQRRAHDRR